MKKHRFQPNRSKRQQKSQDERKAQGRMQAENDHYRRRQGAKQVTLIGGGFSAVATALLLAGFGNR